MANLGKVVITPRGTWTGPTNYVKLDCVLYNGSTWLALQSSIGVTPVEGSYWTLMAQGFNLSDINASDIEYDNTTSGLDSNNAQEAIDELKVVTDSLENSKVAKGEIVINVKDYGAMGDGITDDYLSIVNSILALTAMGGGKLLFPFGTYIISQYINLTQSNIIFMGSYATLYMNFDTDYPLFMVTGDNVSFIGLKFNSDPSYARLTSNSFIFTLGAENINIDACTFDNCPCATIHIRDTINGSITNNKISDSKADGVHISNASKNINVFGNILNETLDDSLSAVWYSDGSAPPQNIKFSNNIIINPHNKGVNVSHAKDVMITNNIIDGAHEKGIGICVWDRDDYAERITVQGNIINNIGSASDHNFIFVEYAKNCTVISNICDICSGEGILFGDCEDVSFKDNVLRNIGHIGIHLIDYRITECDNITFDGNNIYNTVHDALYISPITGSTLTNMYCHDNKIWESTTGDINSYCAYFSDINNFSLISNTNHDVKTFSVDTSCTNVLSKHNNPNSGVLVQDLVLLNGLTGTAKICSMGYEEIQIDINITHSTGISSNVGLFSVGGFVPSYNISAACRVYTSGGVFSVGIIYLDTSGNAFIQFSGGGNITGISGQLRYFL